MFSYVLNSVFIGLTGCFESAKDICTYFEFIWSYLNNKDENYIETIVRVDIPLYVCKEHKNDVQNERSDEIKLMPKIHYWIIGHVPFKSL